jgi:hypothetical protein
VTAPGPHLSEDGLVDLVAGLDDDTTRAARLRHLERCVPCERRLLLAWRDAERSRGQATPNRLVAGWGWEAPLPQRRRLVPAVVAAAVVAVVLLSVPLMRGRRAGASIDAWLPVDSEQTLLRSAEIDGDEVYAEAVAAYAHRDARRVIALLSGRTIPPSREPMKLLLASALVMDGRAAEARSLIEAMDVPTLPQPARDRARFTLAAALAGEGKPREAEAQLHRLQDSPEFAERAAAARRALGPR